MVLIGSLFCFSIGAYRSVMVSMTGERDWAELLEIEFAQTIKDTFTKGATSVDTGGEMEVGIKYMSAIAEDLAFDYGLFHWDQLIYNFVPGQIVGNELKESLMLKLCDPVELSQKKYGFSRHSGLTCTGMVDCYGSFWYFGALKFFAIGWILKYLYRRACRGELMFQLFYIYLLTMGLHSITHHTAWFVRSWVLIPVFWYPIIYWSMRKKHFKDSHSVIPPLGGGNL